MVDHARHQGTPLQSAVGLDPQVAVDGGLIHVCRVYGVHGEFMKRLATAVALTLPLTALAEDGERPDFEFALVASPLVVLSSPFVPGVELTTEWEAGLKFGIGFVGALGSNGGLVWAGGLQANGYFYGDFSTGLLLGAEYMVHTFDNPGDMVSATGAYVGGKYAFPFGFTGMLHVGANWSYPEIAIGDGEIGPLVNVGIGWSF